MLLPSALGHNCSVALYGRNFYPVVMGLTGTSPYTTSIDAELALRYSFITLIFCLTK